MIAALANPDPATLARYQGTVSDLASRGYRALGVAKSDDGKTWQLLGLISLNDPPRPGRQGHHRARRSSLASTSRW